MPLAAISRDNITKKYMELHRLYVNTDKHRILSEAESYIISGNYDAADKLLSKLDDKDTLIVRLLVHLKDKPVFKTIRKVLSGESDNIYKGLKALFSLGTHVSIELEKGNMEYRVILDDVLDAIYKQLAKEKIGG